MLDLVRNRTILPMLDRETGKHKFDIIVYGRRPSQLQIIPNAIVQKLAEKYSHVTTSPFHLYMPGEMKEDMKGNRRGPWKR